MSKLSYSTWVCVIVWMVGLCSCHRHDYHDLPSTAAVLEVRFDWNGYTVIPPGMNLLFYPVVDKAADAHATPILHQLQYDGGRVSLPFGCYKVLVYNDYTDNLLYRGMETYETAEVYLQEHTRLPLASRPPRLPGVAEPDLFYLTQVEELTFTPTDAHKVVTVRPRLKTLQLFVHVEVKGLEYVSMAEGSITGSAGSLRLATGFTAEETERKRMFSFTVQPRELYAESKMFLSNDPLRTTYWLELAFLLRNNQVSYGKFAYDVSDQIIPVLQANEGNIPPEGIHIYIKGVEVEKVSNNGFDAVINEWGDEVNIELN